MRKRWLAALAAAAVVIVLAVADRHALVRFVLERGIGAATGYRVSIGDQHLGFAHGALTDVHVSRDGEKVLDATRIDVYYALRDLLPGSTHRFGLTGIAIAAPQFTAIRHPDGTYNVILPAGAAPSASAPGRPDPVPLRFTVRIRDGGATLTDQAEFAVDHASQRIVDVKADATIDSSARTHYVATGALLDTAPEPFRAVGTVDLARGYALHHLQAKAVPIRTIGNFVINSAALRILAGTAHDVDAKLYALGIAPGVPFAYHVGASLDVADGQLYVESLAEPLDDIRGRLQIVDDALFAKRLGATLGGIPVAVTGGLFDFSHPQLRFGMTGSGDLSRLRSALHFAEREPVRGVADVGVLIEGPTSAPIVVARGEAAHAYYGSYPLDRVSAAVALAGGVVYLSPLRATYAGVATTVRGTLTLGSPPVAELAIHGDASSDALPYADELLPHEPIAFDALLHGPTDKLAASGSLDSPGGAARIAALFSFSADGVAEIAPFSLHSGAGSLIGRYRLDRPSGDSAFWAYGRDLALRAPSREVFPGAKIPQLPAISGTVRRLAVVGGGNGKAIELAGSLAAENATVSGVGFSTLSATFGGDLSGARISSVQAAGPWGRFDGAGSFSTAGIVARGDYAGTLEGLHPFLGGASGSGGVRGPVALSIAPHRIVVQGDDLAFDPGAQIDGIGVSRASGTIADVDGAIRVYSARAGVAGGSLVAAGTYAVGNALALVGTGLHGGGLHGLGIPLQSGAVAVAGRVGATHGGLPSFDGGVVVRRGTADGYPVSGSADLALHGGTLAVSNGVGALGSAVGLIGGTIAGLDAHRPTYAVRAEVPAADVAGTLHTLHLPDEQTVGVFNGFLAIGGAGASPTVSGPIAVPGGAINGLPFVDAFAHLDADRGGVSARYGGARVGSTDVRFSAIVRKDEHAVSVRANRADLSDFNNYFDTGDTLAGVGAIAFSLDDDAGRIDTAGDLDVAGFRYRALPIGDTVAHWTSARNHVTGRLSIASTHGDLHAGGSVDLAPTSRIDRLVADSSYDVTATLDDLDLSTWLPAFGYPELPLLGRVDASARVRGAYPHLRLIGEADLENGSFSRLPIDSLRASVGADGDALVLRDAELEAPALAATASGRLGLTSSMPIALDIHAISDDPAHLVAQLTRKDVPISGTFETTAQVGGTFAAPTLQAAFDATDFTAYGVVAKTLFGSARLVGNNVELRNAGATFEHGEATLAGTLPLELAPFRVADDRPLNFDLSLQAVDPGTFDAALGNDTHLGGTIDGHVNLAGTLLQPHVYGKVSVAGGSYVGAFDRTPVTQTVASLTFDKTTATLESFDAHLGTGRLTGHGTIAFAQGFGAYGDVNYALHAVAKGAQLDVPSYGSGTIDATLDLTRTPPGIARLVGSATATDATVPFAAFLGAGGSGGGGAKPEIAGLPIDLGLDLALKAGNDVRIRGGGLGFNLDIGASGSAKLGGQLAKPTLDGRFVASNGTLTYYDRAFRVNSASVSFDPADGIVPVLHAVGTTHVVNPDPNRTRNPYGSADISIKVDGSLPNLAVSFESDPPGYTRDQIIALIAPFGGFVGGIAFDPATGNPSATLPGNLPGAPLANTGQALPGVQVPQTSGTLTVGQEAFNILNAQFTSGILAPIENVLSTGLGLDSVALTVDYYGNIGINLRRHLHGHLNAVFASTFGIPSRESVGLEYAPTDSTVAQLSAFFESGTTRLYQTPGTSLSGASRITAGQALQGSSGFSLTIQRLFW